MSLSCEGKSKTEPSMPSPSMVDGGPKFGVAGANVNRMLALSEKSRTVNTSKPQAQVSSLVFS